MVEDGESLNVLRTFPFDKIKIDVCFVHDLLAKRESRAIIKAIAQLAGSLGMKTIAKGVETQGELDYVKRAGCTEAQGYLFGKVVPPGEARGLLKVRPDRTQAAA